MRRKILLAGFAIAAVFTVFFVARAVFFAFFWMNAGHEMRPVEPWMTPRYIAHTYKIPREDMQDILHLQPGEHPSEPLEKIAQDRGVDVQDMMKDLEALVLSRRVK